MSRSNRQAGQALVFGVTTLGLLLLGFAGLGIDIGYLRYQKRLQQTAADAAAIAGASNLLPSASGGVMLAAQNAAATDGFTDSSGNTVSTCTGTASSTAPTNPPTICVQINNPPSTGPHSTDFNYVEALVSVVQPTFFMKLLGTYSEPVTARAVASANVNSNGCIYTLGTLGTDLTVTGAATISAPSCGLVDDGGLLFGGTIQASSIGVAGTVTNAGGTINPAPITGIPPAADPLTYLTPPSAGGTGGGGCTTLAHVTGGTLTLNPPPPGQAYCGLNVSGGTVTLNPGVYVFTGDVTITGGTIDGTSGVMIYQTAGSLNISGAASVNLVAPTTSDSATYAAAGVVYWQDKIDTNAATINGASLEGALYFPGASLTLAGGPATPYQIIVANTVTISGGTVTLNSDFSSLPNGSPIKDAVLVE